MTQQPPRKAEWNFSTIDRLPEAAQRIVYFWEYYREWLKRKEGPYDIPPQIRELLSSVVVFLGRRRVQREQVIRKTPFLSIPSSIQKQIFDECGYLADRISTRDFGERKLSIPERHLPDPKFRPRGKMSARSPAALIHSQNSYRDSKWQELRKDFEHDYNKTEVKWLIACFEITEPDDDLRARFDDWIRRVRANRTVKITAKKSANRRGSASIRTKLEVLGKYRVAKAYESAFGTLPHVIAKGQIPAGWTAPTKTFKRKSHFDQVEKSVSKTLEATFRHSAA